MFPLITAFVNSLYEYSEDELSVIGDDRVYIYIVTQMLFALTHETW